MTQEQTSAPIVETVYGKVRGARSHGLSTFAGIRYAASTAGRNRFAPPQPPESWAGVRDARAFGASAPQTDTAFVPDDSYWTPGFRLWAEEGATGEDPAESEDCLFLNVWTPDTSPEKALPVMVWLHPGGVDDGSGSTPLYSGARLATSQNVVVVSLNHRLSSLGYLHLEALGGERFAGSGNAGTLDQIAALEWVRDNISGFGGDPSRVTIFGESGGGWKVCTLLGVPRAKGLFHRAIAQSGAPVRLLDAERAEKAATLLLRRLGIGPRNIDELLEVPYDRIVSAGFAVERSVGGPLIPNFMTSFAPVVDGTVIPEQPFVPRASALGHDVPLMIGTTRTEDTPHMPAEELDLTEEGLTTVAREWLGDDAERGLRLYAELYPNASPSRRWAYLHTDVTTLPFSPVIAAHRAERGGAPTYAYRFDWETDVLEGRLIAPHGVEVPLVFGTFPEHPQVTGDGPRVHRISRTLGDVWGAFARTGDPNTPDSGLPHWPAYDGEDRATMIFDDASRVEHRPQTRESAFALEMEPTFRRLLAERQAQALDAG